VAGHRRIGDRIEQAVGQHADVEHEIERGEAEQPAGRSLRRTLVWLTITAISLYLVAPSLLEVLGSWSDVDRLAPAWLVAMGALQFASLACLWELQRLAIHTRRWHPVIASQLAGNALSKVAPGGGAVGAALQYKMLVQAGIERARAVAGLTAANLLTLSVVLALPVLTVPVLLRGGVDSSLVEAAVVGLVVFAALFAVSALLLATDGPLAWVGLMVQRLRNRLRRGARTTVHREE